MWGQFRRITFWVLGSAGFTLFAMFGALEHGRFKITHAELIGPSEQSPEGGRLQIRYRAENPKTCPATVSVAVRRPKGENIVTVWRHQGIAASISEQWTAEVRLPALPPGSYTYHTTFNIQCGERIHAAVAPAVPFVVR